MTKQTKIIIGVLVAGIPVVSCSSCCLLGMLGEEDPEARAQLERLIDERRTACQSPRVFRVTEGGLSTLPSDWECVSAEVVEAEEAARLATAESELLAAEAAPSPEGGEVLGQEEGQGEEELLPVVGPLADLLAVVDESCAIYEDAPNDIRRSAVFNDHRDALGDVVLSDVHGTLRRLATPQGGRSVTVEIEVERGPAEGLLRRVPRTRFRTGAFAPIERGSTLYEHAADLEEDGCVVFSAERIEPPGLATERQKVCSLAEFVVRFTALDPCGPD